METIGSSAFSGCVNLQNVNLHKNIKTIGETAFSGCNCSVFIDCEIPDTGNRKTGVFYNANLKTVTYGDNVIEIPKDIFVKTTIEDLHISKTIQTINTQYFWNSNVSTNDAIRSCYGLTIYNSISVDEDNPVFKSENNCLIESSNNMLLFGCNNSIIPEYVEKVRMFAFFNNQIDNFVLPKNITTFPYQRVSGETITIDMDLSIDDFLWGLRGLTYQVAFIGNNVNTIGSDGLNRAEITRLVINKNVTYINPMGVYKTISFIDLREFDHAFNIFNESSTTVHVDLVATFIVPDELYDDWITMPCIGKVVKSSEYSGV